MTDNEFLQDAAARCVAGGGSAPFSNEEIDRLVSLSGVDGIDYVGNDTGYHPFSERLVRWLVELSRAKSGR